jgi:hypothetical protein
MEKYIRDECLRMAINIISNTKGDNLERCKAAFQGLDENEMQKPYVRNGRTRQEILDGYQSYRDSINTIIKELEEIKQEIK